MLVRHHGRLLEMFEPLQNALWARLGKASVLHADETSWPAQNSGKNGNSYRGWLWLCASFEVICLQMMQARSAEAGQVMFKAVKVQGEHGEPIYLVCDRYRAYHPIARQHDLTLAFCWVHLRRDFRKAGNYEGLESWSEKWLKRIGELNCASKLRNEHYRAGDARGKVRNISVISRFWNS